MKNITGLIILSVGALCIASSCNHSEKSKEHEKNQVKNTSYSVVTLQPHQISSTVQQPGVMQPFFFVQLFPKINGFVKEVYVDRGSVVHKGQVLIRLEAPEVQENISAARLRYTQAHATYEMSKDRYVRLVETSKTPGTVSPFDLTAAQSKMQADSATAQGSYAEYKAQQAMGDYLTVTAPFDGVITERDVHPGALVGPGTGSKPMLILEQHSKLRLTVNIPEQYSAQIKDGDVVHYHVNALPGQEFTGKVSRASGSLSENFRSETLEIDVENPKDIFKPGMYAEVDMPVSGDGNAFVVPRSAVVTTTERKYVIVNNNNTAKWVDVTEGNTQGDSTEVFGQLHDGDQVVANGTYQIRDGQSIAVK